MVMYNEAEMSEQDIIEWEREQLYRQIASQHLTEDEIVECIEEQEVQVFDPFHIAMDWPKHTPRTPPGIAWGLWHMGYKLSLERIELVSICLEAMENWGNRDLAR